MAALKLKGYTEITKILSKAEKVWIQCNWTELDVAEELMEQGVERNDIVLGFIPENERKYTGYAAWFGFRYSQKKDYKAPARAKGFSEMISPS